MDKKAKWGLVGLLLLGGAVIAQAAQTGTTEKTILALENQWLQAAKTQNPDLIAANYDDRFVDTDSSGKLVSKADGLAELKTTKLSSADYENVQVTIFGDTVIAAGGYKAKGTDSKGKAFDVHERWTDTWVKMPGGKWICVASHSTPIA